MGRPKAWLPFGDEVLLQRVVRLARVGIGAGPIAVVAAPEQELPGLPEGTIVARDPVEGRGPLQGLATGLAALPDEVELVYATATDVPFLQPAWIRRLAERIGRGDLAIPYVAAYHHPLAALYRRETILPAVRELLARGLSRPVCLLEQVTTRVLSDEELRDIDPEFSTLRNLNDLSEYESALRDAGLGRRDEQSG